MRAGCGANIDRALSSKSGREQKGDIIASMVMVGGATVTQADVYASNGVAHVIDRVLVP